MDQCAGRGLRAHARAGVRTQVVGRHRDGQRRERRAVLQQVLRVKKRVERDAGEVEARQGGATGEHVLHRRRLRDAEAADLQGRQARALVEHVVHRRHQCRAERAHVEARQAAAPVEHRGHVGGLRRVQVLQVRNRGEARHPVEPAVAGRGSCTGEGVVEVDGGDARAGVRPAGGVRAGVQVIGRAGAARTVGVVAEGQFLAVGRKPGVGLCRCRIREATCLPLVPAAASGVLLRSEPGGIHQRAGRGLRANIGAGVGVKVTGRGRDGQRCEGRAVLQHVLRVKRGTEGDAREVEARQGGATGEHVLHRRGLRDAEAAHGEACQFRAFVEHVVHRGHQCRVEGAHVKARQAAARVEHRCHVGGLRRVQVAQVRNRGEVRHAVEPAVAGRRTGTGERVVEVDGGDARADVRPAGGVRAGVQVIGRTGAARTVGVVAERQFLAVRG